jgi:copper transport protein
MTFTEPVSVANSGVRLFDPDGQEVEASATARGEIVTVSFPQDAADGTWTVAWSMISADGHPISGAWVFHVGSARGGADVTSVESASVVVKWLRIAARSILLMALLSLVAPLLWRPISEHAEVVAASIVWIGLAGIAIADGLNIASSGDPPFGEVLRVWLSTKSGLGIAIAAGLALVAHVLTLGTELPRRAVAGAWAAVLIAVTMAGHAAILPPVLASAILTPIHVLAAILWAGGVIALELNWPPDAAEVRRLTRVASGAVVLVAVTGLALVLIRTPPSELLSSAYGRLGLAKIVVLIAVLILAGVNRFALGPDDAKPQRGDDGWSAPPKMRTVVRAEAALLLGLVVIGSILGSTPPPPKERAADSAATTVRPIVTDAEFGKYTARVTVAPGEVGSNEVTVAVIDPSTGTAPTDLSELRLSMVNEALGIGPLEEVGEDPGSAAMSATFDLTARGTWQLIVDGRIGTFEFLRARVDVDL